MNIPMKLLKHKKINPLQKLILGLILSTSSVVIQMAGGYSLTCGEIGAILGVSRARIKKEIESLVELEYITTRKGNGWRKTNITSKLEEILNT